MKFSRYALSIATFLVAASTLLAQGSNAFQAEGTAGDLIMRTAVNGGPLDTLDKPMLPGDLFTIDFSSATGSTAGAPIFLAADIAPVSFQWELFGVIGLGQHRFLVIDGVADNVYNPTQLNFVVPCSEIWNTGLSAPVVEGPDVGLWLQSVAYNGTGSFFGFEVSETIKHEVIESATPCTFYDTCGPALAGSGINTATDLGVPFTVDTTGMANDIETTGTSGFGTQTLFMTAAPGTGSGSGNGTSPDVFCKLVIDQDGIYTFDLCASGYDTRFHIIPATCTIPQAGIVSNDDGGAGCGSDGFRSRISNFCMFAGTYLMVVDGFGSGNFGVANLTITRASTSIGLVFPGAAICPGTNVTITGQAFQAGATVTIGGVPAAIVSQNTTCGTLGTQIVVTPPTLPNGAHDVTVTNPDSTSATAVGAFTVGGNQTTTLTTTSSPALSDDGTIGYPLLSCANTFTFYGVAYTDVKIEMNGRLRFGTSTSGAGDFSESTADLRTQAPSINLFWDDCFDPASTTAAANITIVENTSTLQVQYNNVPRYTTTDGFSNGSITLNKATGQITLSYGACNARGAITGISPGLSLFATVPAETNLSVAGSFTPASPLLPIFEQMTGPTGDPFDLSGLTIRFTPTANPQIYTFSNP